MAFDIIGNWLKILILSTPHITRSHFAPPAAKRVLENSARECSAPDMEVDRTETRKAPSESNLSRYLFRRE